MKRFTYPLVVAVLVSVAGTSVLGRPADAQMTSVVVLQPNQRVYSYPEGRYELRGEGTASSPYYWVWIPTGVQSIPTVPALPSVVIQQPGPRVYTYPEGRFELRGEGTTTSPFYWVWIPAGIQSIPPAPALPSVVVQPSQPVYALPPLPTVVQPGPRVYTYPEGRYELRGEGTATNPFYWVWIPAGIQSIPAAPALPSVNVQPSQRAYAYPEGRYELRGEGTATNPYYWVWIPNGTVSQAPLPRYQLQADMRSAEGRIAYFDPWARTMTLYGGKSFVLPPSFAATSPLGIGEQVVVTYYVAQDGRNVVRSIDHSVAQ